MTDKKWFENYDKAPESFYNNAEYLFRDEIRKGDDQMTDTKHTPTPWWIREVENSDSSIGIAVMGENLHVIADDEPCYPRAISRANAAHIVKCVNMHDELVEALVNTVKAWENTKSGKTSVSEIQRWLIEDMKPAIDELRETIKKAGAL